MRERVGPEAAEEKYRINIRILRHLSEGPCHLPDDPDPGCLADSRPKGLLIQHDLLANVHVRFLQRQRRWLEANSGYCPEE